MFRPVINQRASPSAFLDTRRNPLSPSQVLPTEEPKRTHTPQQGLGPAWQNIPGLSPTGSTEKRGETNHSFGPILPVSAHVPLGAFFCRYKRERKDNHVEKEQERGSYSSAENTIPLTRLVGIRCWNSGWNLHLVHILSSVIFIICGKFLQRQYDHGFEDPSPADTLEFGLT